MEMTMENFDYPKNVVFQDISVICFSSQKYIASKSADITFRDKCHDVYHEKNPEINFVLVIGCG